MSHILTVVRQWCREYDENGTNRVQVTGAQWTWNTGIQVSGFPALFDQVKIEDNVISLEIAQKVTIKVTKNAISKELTDAVYPVE